METIARGFLSRHQSNPFAVSPTFHFWAPWIGRNTRRTDRVLNTDFLKVRESTEEQLKEELGKQKVQLVRRLCRECGLDSSGSRSDLLLRLFRDTKSRQTLDQVMQKVWASSGGWAVICCPCGVVYSIKSSIGPGGLRDFADLLLSWTHMPNVVIHDAAHGLASHMNRREPDRTPFSPFEGRLRSPSLKNRTRASTGRLKVSLPWLDSKKPAPDRDGHPATRLLDWMRNNDYFLKSAPPSTQMFLMRNIVHNQNQNQNQNQQRLEATDVLKPENGE